MSLKVANKLDSILALWHNPGILCTHQTIITITVLVMPFSLNLVLPSCPHPKKPKLSPTKSCCLDKYNIMCCVIFSATAYYAHIAHLFYLPGSGYTW